MRSSLRILFIALTYIAICATAVFAQKASKEMKSAEDRADGATTVINEIMGIDDKAIPRDLLAKAKAIVVFPGSLKVSFIVGGQGGKGVVVRRLASGWSAPAFMNMGGGSFGPQIGGQKTDYVLLIMNDEGLKGLLGDKFEIGAEGSVSAGPVGRTAAASTNVRLDAQILTYSRSKGLFAGVSLKGVVISPDESINTSVYQKTAKQILGDNGVLWSDAPASLQNFPKTVSNYTK